MSYTIRSARLSDAAGIAEVARDTWNDTYADSVAPHNRQSFLDQAYTSQVLHAAIRDERGWFYVAEQATTDRPGFSPLGVVGYAQYMRRFDDQGELVRLYVHPDHQRRGIGRALLAAGLRAMATAGMRDCYVSVEASNAGARAFYERFGFRPVREYGRFLGDQIIRLVEYVATIPSLG
jgi:ribosomal protein S18 acetylase RimI-like enzyme